MGFRLRNRNGRSRQQIGGAGDAEPAESVLNRLGLNVQAEQGGHVAIVGDRAPVWKRAAGRYADDSRAIRIRYETRIKQWYMWSLPLLPLPAASYCNRS